MRPQGRIARAGVVLALMSVMVIGSTPLAAALCAPPAAPSQFSCHESPSQDDHAPDSESCCAIMSCMVSSAPGNEPGQISKTAQLLQSPAPSSFEFTFETRPTPESPLPHPSPPRHRLSLLSLLLI